MIARCLYVYHMTLNYENCEIKYDIDGDVIIIENIQVPQNYRNQGFAKKALCEFLNKFVEHRIEGYCYPQDNETSLEKLLEFYKSFGFKVGSGDDSFGWEIFKK